MAQILAVTNYCSRAHSMLSMLLARDYSIHCVSNCHDALRYLHEAAPVLILCESRLEDGNWRTLMEALAKMKSAPLLVVYSAHPADPLLTEALDSEGYEVEVKQLDLMEVGHHIQTAIEECEVTSQTMARSTKRTG